jgi:hypothetical protein
MDREADIRDRWKRLKNPQTAEDWGLSVSLEELASLSDGECLIAEELCPYMPSERLQEVMTEISMRRKIKMEKSMIVRAEEELIEEAKQEILSRMKHMVRKRINLQEKLDGVNKQIRDLEEMDPAEFLKDSLKNDPHFQY